MRGEGPFAEQIRQLHALWSRKLGMGARELGLSTDGFHRPGEQLGLF
jgi:hypothetical protein